MKNLPEVWLPCILFALFFVIQVFFTPTEYQLTALLVVLEIFVFFLFYRKREWIVYVSGLGLGLFIEVVLGLVARQQHWEGASLLGVPLWLPLAWGIGFIAIGRFYKYVTRT
jgi:hypothetical protein